MRENDKKTVRVHEAAIVYFDAVWRLGSFRAAAPRLNVASSAVNRQILKLETILGAPLFERIPGGVRLTAAGEIFAFHAKTVIQDFERAVSQIDALRGLQSGHVEIATVEGLCVDLLPATISHMRSRHRGITFGIDIRGIPDMPRAVLSGDVHLGIAFQVPRTANLIQLALGRFRVGAVMRPDHPLAGRPHLTFQACAQHALLFAKSNLAIRRQLEPAMGRAALGGRPVIEAASLEIMKQLALRGVGIAFQTRIGLEAELGQGSLVHVPLHDGGPVTQDLGVYARAESALPVAVDAFVQLVAGEIERRQKEDAAPAP